MPLTRIMEDKIFNHLDLISFFLEKEQYPAEGQHVKNCTCDKNTREPSFTENWSTYQVTNTCTSKFGSLYNGKTKRPNKSFSKMIGLFWGFL